MKLGKFYVLFALFILVGWKGVFAQSATFSDIRLEHNVPDENGRKMLQFHYKMSVSGCQGHNVRAVMWVDIPQGVTHHCANGNKMIAEHKNMYCTWENTTTTGDWWVGIYNDVLNPLPGKNTYYTRLGAWDETLGKYIGWSDFLSFENTGSEKSVASSGGSAQKAIVQNVWVDLAEGKEFKNMGYKIHAKFDVSGMLNKQIKVIAYIYDANKNPVLCKRINPLIVKLLDIWKVKDQFVFEGYRTNNNQISASATAKPSYENTTYNDFSLFLPFSAIIPFIPIGKATYLVRVRVYDTKNKVFLSDFEPYESFPSVGTSWEFLAQMMEAMNGSKIENKGNLIRKSEYEDSGFYSCTFIYDSGWNEYFSLTNCFVCNNTGKSSCIPCLGTGYTTQYAYPNNFRVPCSSCGTSGFVPCSFCGGLGISIMLGAFNEKLHLQYVDGKFSPYYPTNETPPIQPSFSGDSQSSSSSSIGNETTTRVCTFCNATGLVPSEDVERVGRFFDTPTHYCTACCRTHHGDSHVDCPVCKGKRRY